ncbi:MAG TPA: hypothetical protein VNA30_04665 [Mycobacteriales bacterium]|nr:hypothetical protein [Mycobacteriales bacterium]
MSGLCDHSPRSALLSAWASAWLAGDCSLLDAVAHAAAYDDAHGVLGMGPDELHLEQVLGRLRASGVVRFRVVLPVPGDIVGLPAPGPFSVAAVDAAEGVLALRSDGTGTGLVPAVEAHGSALDGTVTTTTWTAYDVVCAGPDPGPFLHDAEHDLRTGVAACAELLAELDVARWRPEVATALQDLRRRAAVGIDEDELPGGYPARARRLLGQARQLAGVLSLANQDHGSALDTRQMAGRERALRDLEQLVRRAQVAAYNAYADPA